MGQEKRILVVDDEAENLAAVKRIFFEDVDICLDFADSGKSALEKVRSFGPDLVLLDILMPEMDGYQVCREIKKMPDTAGVMVLLLSGKAELQDRIKGYEAAADDYITKPYEVEELKAKVNILLRLKGTLDELKLVNLNLESLVWKRTRELIQKEQQAIVGRMVQGIVHNLKGPFTGVKGFACLAQMSLQECLAAADQCSAEMGAEIRTIANYVDQSLFASKKLEEMINDLLNKGRRDASSQKTTVNLNAALKTEFDFLQADMELKHKIKKVLQLSDHLPLIQGVYSDFSQIFCNLIKNAVDAMRGAEKKELTIISRHDAQNIIFEFKDSGAGIKDEIMDKIFDAFFSTKEMKDEGRQGESFGTGLGLYTCAEIIRLYHGRISAENREGGGACFTVTIPLSPNEIKV